MKKVLLLFSLSFLFPMLSVGMYAQEQHKGGDRWIGSVEFDPAVISLGSNVNDKVSFSPRITATGKVMQYLSLGGGLALTESWKFKAAPMLDIFARAHAEDFNREFTPFLDLDLGYSLSMENTNVHGFVFNPTIGVRYGKFGLGLGYKGFVDSNGGLGSSINVRFAYYFGYHKSEAAMTFFKKLDFSVAAGAVFPFSNGKKEGEYLAVKSGATLEVTALYPFFTNFTGGLLVGFDYLPIDMNYDGKFLTNDSRSSLLVGIRGRYDIRQVSLPLKIHPFVKADIGVASNFDTDEGSSSFYYAPGVGLSLPVREEKSSLDLGVSYAPVYVEKDATWKDKGNAHDIGSIRLTLGYTF